MKQQKQYNSFDFLLGNDAAFNDSLKSIDLMYDGLHNDEDQKDPIFQNIKVINNDILAPIDKMSKQMNSSKPNQAEPKYKKVSQNANIKFIGQIPKHQEEDQFIVGQPVYQEQKPYQQYKYPQQNYFGKNKHL